MRKAAPWLHISVCMTKTDSSADYQILNSFETHTQSPGLNYSKHGIGNVRVRPTQKYLLLFADKQRWSF